MSDDNETQESAATPGSRAGLRAMRDAFIAKTKAENAALAAERNSRRWKSERSPEEYEANKAEKRARYAASKGGDVRAYEKIPGKTVAEHDTNAKARHAEKEKDRYAKLREAERQGESDIRADRAFVKRRRAKGVPEDQIAAEFALYLAARAEKRAAEHREADEWAIANAQPHAGVL